MSDAAVRVQTDPRISRRRRAVARSRRRRLFLAGTVAVALSVALWAAFWSPLLQVRAVTLGGARHVTSSDVARVAGIDGSDNLLLLSTKEIAARAESLPWVKRALVERKLPGTVKLSLVERRPAVALSLGAARWLVDASGHVIAPAERDVALPSLAGVEVGEIEPGARLDAAEARSALRTLRSLPPGLRRRVVAVFAPTIQRITLSLDDGTQVRYGAATRRRAKNAVVTALLERVGDQGQPPSYIDVRVPTNPAISFATPTPDADPPAP